MKFQIPEWLHDTVIANDKVEVVVVGAGGTGSEVLSKLFRLNHLIKQLGGAGLAVSIYDDDTVSAANIGRQCFYSFDLGRYKSEVLAERFNQFGDIEMRYTKNRFLGRYIENHINTNNGGVILISCVDNPQSRIEIGEFLRSKGDSINCLWIDGGNDRNTGQVVLGSYGEISDSTPVTRLPSVYDLFETQLKEAVKTFTDTESCSHEEAITKQDFGVNDAIAFQMVQLLWRLLRHGEITNHGAQINLEDTEVSPLAIDPLMWEMYGYNTNKEVSR